MNLEDRNLFFLQYWLGRLFVFFAAPVITLAIRICGYTVADLEVNRRKIASRMKNHGGPWLICANHLTMVDSIIISYVMFPFSRYLVRYDRMPWNIPDKKNLHKIHPIVVVLCYLLKCIPVVRGGNRDQLNATLAKCGYILSKGESLLIFPEGGRSRSGCIDPLNFPYSAGRLAHLIPDCRVMAIYLRGDHQRSYSDFPRLKENFYVAVDDFKVSTSLKGPRAQRECARQIIQKMKEMEDRYFASHRQ